eukprot:611368-Pelagomonas_calceolata.AAC.2
MKKPLSRPRVCLATSAEPHTRAPIWQTHVCLRPWCCSWTTAARRCSTGWQSQTSQAKRVAIAILVFCFKRISSFPFIASMY